MQASRAMSGGPRKELPREMGTQHTEAASTNLRRKVHLPEAIEHLVIQGLSEEDPGGHRLRADEYCHAERGIC